jgi:aspartokinase
MARIVMKFGGTSMAGIERIRHVANLVKREAEAGHQIAVVVSAMAGRPTAWSSSAAKPPRSTIRANMMWWSPSGSR